MGNTYDDKRKTGQLPALVNPLAAAEMSEEGNYNMIDGIINNAPPRRADLTDGQTDAEIAELAPGTLPGNEKPSILEALRQAKEDAAAISPGPAHDHRPPDFDREL